MYLINEKLNSGKPPLCSGELHFNKLAVEAIEQYNEPRPDI
jgi:hypothetical protein